MSAPLGRLCAAGALLLFAVYLFTLCPTVHWLDTGELMTGAFHLSVPHPPGEPVWVLLAKGAALVPIGDIAQRTGVLSALFGALVMPAAAAAMITWSRAERQPSPTLVAAAALAPCLTYPLWVQSVRAEVYSLNLLLTLVTVALLGAAGRDRPRAWMLAALCGGLAAGVHPLLAGLVIVPSIALAALSRGLPRGAALGATAGLALVGLAPFLLLPVRVTAGAPDAWGQPDRAQAFVDTVLARTFQQNFAAPTAERLLDNLMIQGEAVAQGTGWLIPALALAGLLALLGARSYRAALLATLAVGATLWAKLSQSMVFSTNVDLHGYLGVVHVSLWALSAAALAGLVGRLPLSPPSRRVIPTALVLALALGAAATQGADASRAGNDLARLHAKAGFAAVPTGGTLITSGNNTMFVDLYLQEVEGHRPDVRAVHRSLVGHPWYQKRWTSAPRPTALAWLHAARGRPASLLSLKTPVVLEARERDLVDAQWLCPTRPGVGWGYYRLVPPGSCPQQLAATAPPTLSALWEPFPGDVDARLVAGLAAEIFVDWQRATPR